MTNLPPGITESMIPGNRPEDAQWDNVSAAVCELLERLGVPITESATDAELESLDTITAIFIEHWTAHYREVEWVACSWCGQRLDHRRVCPKRSASARFPNGKRCGTFAEER